MPDTIANETDSQPAPTTPQGTGETGNDLSKSTDAGAGDGAAPKGFDEDFLKRLDAIDPATLPVNLRQKLEQPFKADHTKKTTELSELKKQYETEKATAFELARRALAERQAPTGPTPRDTKIKELSELAAAGDAGANIQLQDMLAEEKVAPIRTQITLQNAAQNARSNPLAGESVVQHWNEIVQTMQTDPVIAQLATANNYAAADRVMIALGLEHKVRDLVPKYAEATEKIKALEAKLASYEKERAAGLPSSTTRAGTTNGRPAAGELMDLDAIAESAWLQSGGTRDTFR